MKKILLSLSGGLFLSANIFCQSSLNSAAIGFTENKGQIADQNGKAVEGILFKLPGNGVDMYVTETGISYLFMKPEEKGVANQASQIQFCRTDMVLQGASIKKENIITEFPKEGERNYFYAHCPQGITGVKTFGKIIVKNIYPGIDCALYTSPLPVQQAGPPRFDKLSAGSLQRRGEGSRTNSLPFGEGWGGVKYDFIVSPGADLSAIKLQYKWADTKIDEEGNLVITTPLGSITEQAPVSFQNDKEIKTNFILNHNFLTFQLSNFLTSIPLTIDPPISWATLYGSSGGDGGEAITSDVFGNTYSTGFTSSNVFPTQNPGAGAYFQGTYNSGGADAVILKFSSVGALQWATYYGGNGVDDGKALSCDASGNLFVTGFTGSTDFPLQTLAGAYNQSASAGSYDVFILKFNTSGVRLWATYYGGTSSDQGFGIVNTSSGNIFLCGTTSSNNIPQVAAAGNYSQGAIGGGSDAFILRLNPSHNINWATYYGGNGSEQGYGLTVDPSGNVFIAGLTTSTNLPLQNLAGAYNQSTTIDNFDAFIAKFNTATLGLGWASYYGGSDPDWAAGLASDPSGNIFMTGAAFSTDITVVNPGGGAYYQNSNPGLYDGFITKFNTANALTWATYYGGSDYDYGLSIAASPCGVYLMGRTSSTNLPIYNPGSGSYYQSSNASGGAQDVFFAEFNLSGVRQWATYYGGAAGEANYGGCGVNPSGCLLATGHTGWGISTPNDFPVYNPGGGAFYQAGISNNLDDIFILKFCSSVVCPSALTVAANATPVSCNAGSNGTATALGAGGTTPYKYLWNNNKTTQTITGLAAGTYTVIITDAASATAKAAVIINNPSALNPSGATTQMTCNSGCNGKITTTVTGGTAPYTFSWTNGSTKQSISALCAGTYSLTITDAGGCTARMVGTLLQPSVITLTLTATSASCGQNNGSVLLNVSGGVSPYAYQWSTGYTGFLLNNIYSGIYTVSVTDTVVSGGSTDNINCTVSATITVTQAAAITTTMSATTTTCGQTNGTAEVFVSGGTSPYNYQWNISATVSQISNLISQIYSVTVTDATGCTKTDNVQVGNNPGVNIALVFSGSVTCFGGNNGSLSISASGGNAPYFFQWNTGQTKSQISNLISQIYSATVTDNNGCTSSSAFNITQPLAVHIAATSTDAHCNLNDGDMKISPSGGSGTYITWVNGFTVVAAASLVAGTYSVIVTDSNGCPDDTVIVIANLPGVTAQIISSTNISCNGGNNGFISAGGTGGTLSYSYNWSNGQTSSSIYNLTFNIYNCTVTDASGCTSVISSVITQPALLTVIISVISDCKFSSASANVNGGVGPYQYNWSNGSFQFAVSGLLSAIYSLTITDANSCIISQAINISATSSVSALVCCDTTIESGGSANLNASGGGNYFWFPSTGLSCTTCNDPVANPLGTIDYCVVVSDNIGCADTSCVTITVELHCDSLFIPSAFSPNSDNENDVLCIYGNKACVESFHFSVYDRWGEKIFVSDNVNECWDGISDTGRSRSDRGEMDAGVFLYLLEATLINGETIIKRGNITLVR